MVWYVSLDVRVTYENCFGRKYVQNELCVYVHNSSSVLDSFVGMESILYNVEKGCALVLSHSFCRFICSQRTKTKSRAKNRVIK